MISLTENISLISDSVQSVKNIDTGIRNDNSEDSNLDTSVKTDKNQTDKFTPSSDFLNMISEKKNASGESTKSADSDDKKTEEEKKKEEASQKYKKIEEEVKAHERAHKMAGGSLVRGATSFTYVVADDGKRYISAGEVKIDMSIDPNKPEESIRQLQQVQRAALAPSDPSGQDRAVAAEANSKEAQLRAQMIKDKSATSNTKSNSEIFDAYKKQSQIQQPSSGISSLENTSKTV